MAKPSPVVFNSSSPWASRFQQMYLLGEASGTPQDSGGGNAWPLNTVKGVAPTWVQGSDGLCIRCAGNGAFYTDTTVNLVAAYPLYMAASFSTTSTTNTWFGPLADTVTNSAGGGGYGSGYFGIPPGTVHFDLRVTAAGLFAAINSSSSAQSDKACHCLWVSFSSSDHRLYANPGTGGVKDTLTKDIGTSNGNMKRLQLGGSWMVADAPAYFQGDIYFAAVGNGGSNIPTDAECLDFVNNPYQLYVAQGAPPAVAQPRITVAA
jgi:hypothetical protein